jgi:hypothetical protein
MRIFHAVILAATLCLPATVSAAQAPTNPPQNPAPARPPAHTHPSELLKPSLDSVQQTLYAVKLDKWKRGTVREEAGDHINALLKDIENTLPPLLQDADAAPGTFSKVLPMYRNVDAFYDVLLRVVEAARVSAPADQVTQLEEALIGLSKARRTLDDRLQDMAVDQEKQLGDLRSTVQKQTVALSTASAVAPAPAPVPCTPAPRPKAKKKPNPPPATQQATTPAASPKSGP